MHDITSQLVGGVTNSPILLARKIVISPHHENRQLNVSEGGNAESERH